MIEFADINSSTILAQQSRYLKSNVIYYGDNKKITFTLYKREEYTSGTTDRVYLITSGTEYRPDLVAYDAYGLVDVWWKIMEINKIYDIWEFKAGKTIILPADIFE